MPRTHTSMLWKRICMHSQMMVSSTYQAIKAPSSIKMLSSWKSFCDVLVSLEVASPEYGKAIACLLTGKSARGKNKKVDVCPAIPKKKFAGYKGAIGSIARAIGLDTLTPGPKPPIGHPCWPRRRTMEAAYSVTPPTRASTLQPSWESPLGLTNLSKPALLDNNEK